MPRKHYSLAKNIVHAACLFSICCTVISSIGALIMMISSCVSYLTGLERSFAMECYRGPCGDGVLWVLHDRAQAGMNFLAAQNTRMFLSFCSISSFSGLRCLFEYGHGSFRLHADQFYPQQHAGQYGIYE